MKRSEINHILLNAKAFLEKRKFYLPPWAHWHPDDWKINREKVTEIIENQLGWDITDFGSGNFSRQGLFLFTIRNGRLNVDKKPYAEKIMIVEEGQETPMHYHWSKMEDIINRGGGNLMIELYMAAPGDQLDVSAPIRVSIDGISHMLSAGSLVRLTPGESICLEPGMFHRFFGEPGKGKVLVGEVSAVNDDTRDNCFLDSIGRFPEVVEDETPLHLLVTDYNKFPG